MAKLKPNKPEFLSTNYQYFKVSKLDLFEFEILRDEIIESARRRKVIPERTVIRLFSLLKKGGNNKKSESKLSDDDITDRLEEVISFVEEQRGARSYIFSGEQMKKAMDLKVNLGGKHQIITRYSDFKEMLMAVIQQLRVTESEHYKEWLEDKNFCMKEAFKEFVKFYWWFMSPEQKNKYKAPYKFAALSALLARKVWGFGISEEKDMTMHKYNDHCAYALEKYGIDPNELMATPPSEWI